MYRTSTHAQDTSTTGVGAEYFRHERCVSRADAPSVRRSPPPQAERVQATGGRARKEWGFCALAHVPESFPSCACSVVSARLPETLRKAFLDTGGPGSHVRAIHVTLTWCKARLSGSFRSRGDTGDASWPAGRMSRARAVEHRVRFTCHGDFVIFRVRTCRRRHRGKHVEASPGGKRYILVQARKKKNRTARCGAELRLVPHGNRRFTMTTS